MKCKDCGNTLCNQRTTNAEMDCYFENPENLIVPAGLLNPTGTWPPIPNDRQVDDWSTFRREAAKDIVCAILSAGMEQTDDNNEYFHTFENLAKTAVSWADELIKQLKEK